MQDASEWKVRPNTHATHFQVLEHGKERCVLIFGHGGPTDTIGTYRIGDGTAPELGQRSAVLVGHPDRVALASTTHVPFLAALGMREAIIAVDRADQVRDSIVSDRIRRKLVTDLTSGDGLDRERLLQLRPQVLLGDPFQGDALRTIGIPMVGIAEYLEEHPLGRAEWIRVFGVLFGREAEAERLFAEIAARYEVAAGKAAAAPDRPLVFFGSTWQGQWFVPSGTSYMARTIADAGGRYAFADRPSAGNLTVDVETALAVGANVHYWGTVLAKEGDVRRSDVAGGDERILRTPAFRNGGVFAGNSLHADIFGEAVLRPDEVLLDLSGILHPELKGDRAPVFFRPVAQ
ncbi:MAG TPA: ABC transporter substrate-binding protein [Flavobacteriales bacterium]